MEPMPWDPVRDLLTMQERLESLFGHASPGWVPPADLAELDDRYVIGVEVPGLTREDVQIDVADQLITIRGTRPPCAANTERFHQLERAQGAFSRSFHFSTPVAGDRITADLRDGVLTIVVPKLYERRQIDVL
jgi:HSP20 family protein